VMMLMAMRMMVVMVVLMCVVDGGCVVDYKGGGPRSRGRLLLLLVCCFHFVLDGSSSIERALGPFGLACPANRIAKCSLLMHFVQWLPLSCV
jgi:hypothetical protein